MARVKQRTFWSILTSAAIALGSSTFAPVAAAATVVPLVYSKRGRSAVKPPAPELTPHDAENQRRAIREAVQRDRDVGDWATAARSLEERGATLGDPILIMEASDIRLSIAREERDTEEAQRAIDTTLVALDILYFYDALRNADTTSTWVIIDPTDAPRFITEAKRRIHQADALIEEIEREQAEALAGDEPLVAQGNIDKRPRKMMRPGTGLIIAGAGFTTIGLAGASVGMAGLLIGASKQREVETKQVPAQRDEVERLDAQGRRANIMGYTGVAVAATALAIGVPLLIAGTLKRKSSKVPSQQARIGLSPVASGHHNGFVLFGSF